MRWSVVIEADGDRVMTREEIVELADAVAVHRGIASGIGTACYGAQIVVEADTPDQALARGSELFTAAAATAGLPAWPISELTAVNEDDDLDDDDGDDDDGDLELVVSHDGTGPG